MKKKIFAGLLALCMVISMLPLTAFAENTTLTLTEENFNITATSWGSESVGPKEAGYPVTATAKDDTAPIKGLSGGTGAVTVEYKKGDNGEWGTDAPKTVGTYSARITYTYTVTEGGAKHVGTLNFSKTLTIAPVAFAATDAGATVDGTTVTKTLTKAGADEAVINAAKAVLKVEYKVGTGTADADFSESLPAAGDVDKEYVIYLSLADAADGSYTGFTRTATEAKVTVKGMPEDAFQLTLAMYAAVADATAEYTGSNLASTVTPPAYTKPADEEKAPESATATIVYKQNGSVVTEPTAVGDYEIWVKVADYVADTGSYRGFETNTGKKLSITKKARTLSVTAPTAEEIVVGAEDKSLTITDNASADEPTYNITITPASAVDVGDAGALTLNEVCEKVTVVFNSAETANYQAAEQTQVSFAVLGKARTIAVKNAAVSLNMQDENKTAQIEVLENTKAFTGKVTYTVENKEDFNGETDVPGADVISVNASGLITAKAAGVARVKVIADADKTYKASTPVYVTVTVTNEAAVELTVPTGTVNATYGDDPINLTTTDVAANKITATYQPDSGNKQTIAAEDIDGSSSNTSVATFENGTLTIAGAGKATITVTILAVTGQVGDNAYKNHGAATATFNVEVAKQAVEISSVTLNDTSSYKYDGISEFKATLSAVTSVKAGTETASELAVSDIDIAYSGDVKGPGKVTMTLTPKADKNFTFDAYVVEASEGADYSYEIAKGNAATKTFAATVKPANNKATVDLTNVADMPADGKVTAATVTSTYIDSFSYSGKTLGLNFKQTAGTPTGTDEITVTVETAFYESFTVTLTVTYTTLDLATVSPDSVTLQVAKALDGNQGVCTALYEDKETNAASITAHEADTHKCYDKGYRLAKISDANKSKTITITGATAVAIVDDSTAAALSNAIITATAGEANATAKTVPVTIALNPDYAAKGSVKLKITTTAAEGYAVTTLYVTVTVDEVDVVAPIKDDVTDPSTGDEPGTDDPTPVEDVNVGTDEKGQITEDKKADTNLIITNEDAGIVAGVPAGIEGKVEATVAPVDVTVTTVDEDGNEVEQTVEATKVEIKVDGEIPEIDIPTAITVKEEDLAAIENKDMVVAYVLNEDGTMTALPKSSLNEDGLLTAHVPNGSTVIFKEAESNLTGLDETYEAAANAMNYLSARGIMNGKDNNAAEPKATTNRYELVMMLHNLERNAEKGTVGDFGDVKEGHWASNAVTWAFEMGIAKGDGTNFNGENEMTRQELAVFLYRYAQQYAKGTLSVKFEGEIVDNDKLADWAEEAMRWAVGNGIINGDGNGSVMPQATATREQVAMMLTRLLKAI